MGADVADMQLISEFSKGFRFLLSVIDIYTKYAWVIPLEGKKVLQLLIRKPSKIWVNKCSEFYNRSLKSWLEKKNAIEMYSTHNERKYVVAERFIRTLKNKTYKYMASITKNVYIDKLDYIVNKYTKINHRTIKMKPVV